MYHLLIITKYYQTGDSAKNDVKVNTVLATFETYEDAEEAETQLANFDSEDESIFMESLRLGLWRL